MMVITFTSYVLLYRDFIKKVPKDNFFLVHRDLPRPFQGIPVLNVRRKSNIPKCNIRIGTLKWRVGGYV